MNRGKKFDYEHLLSLLPRHQLIKPETVKPVAPPKWNWPPLKSYNGFTHAERVQTWQVGWWLLNSGVIIKPKKCDICKQDRYVSFHSENYYSVLTDPFLCKSCHTVLHLRFKHPNGWNRLMDRCRGKDDTWFSILDTKEIDLAGYLRAKHGSKVQDLLNSPLYQLPEWLPEPKGALFELS